MNPCTRIAATTSPAVTPRSGKLWTLGGMNTAGLSASCLNLRTPGQPRGWVVLPKRYVCWFIN